MFRQSFRTYRRTALSAAATAAVLVHEHELSRKEKLPIYPQPDPEILLQEVPSELEHQIGKAREAVTETYLDAHAKVQSVVSRWIGVEHAVEERLKSLAAPEEPLTPGLLYVGVAALTGSVLARNRGIFARITLPPVLLLLSFNHFLPKTAENVSAYLGALEDKYAPALAEKHAVANAHTRMTWEMLKDKTAESRASLGASVESLLDRIQDTTGLKVREALRIRSNEAQGVAERARDRWAESVQVAQRKAQAAREAVQAKVAEARETAAKNVEHAQAVVAEKTEEVKAAVVEKVEDAKAAVEHKAEQTEAVVEQAKEEVKAVVEEKPQPPKRLV
ncbi:apolipo protein O-domain-containing protein [Phanerochaete sordida]|uniref:MICOS complex subunit n=1 Tax=Phanerochaete sordida TaxID=48140 RepID=A0A9P3G297_9APHY|nr:apolipo protein O-domain-containing protein [Phanerochaete sordida]